jgi:hypothetical protein
MREDVIDAPIGNDIHRVQVTIFVYVFTLNKMLCSLQLDSEYQWMDLFYIQLGGPALDVPKRCCRQEFAELDTEQIGNHTKNFALNMIDCKVISLME